MTLAIFRRLAVHLRPSPFEITVFLVLSTLALIFFRPQERLRLETFSAGTAMAATFQPVGGVAQDTLAVLTPTAAFGQEENRQSVAQIFVSSIAEMRPDLQVTPLSETLSRVNAAGLADIYRKLYDGYGATGLFDRALLKSVGQAARARYLVQLKLQSFNQATRPRFGYFGVNIVQTQTANVRLFVQIWDAATGEIVWERSAEAARQTESIREKPVTMESVVAAAFAELIAKMPSNPAATEGVDQ